MPSYAGKYHYSSDPSREGPCQVSFTSETFTLTPASGTPIAFDLGDVDVAIKNDWDVQLELFTGRHLTLRQFGPAFDRMSGELIAAWRNRNIRCMLLEDLEPIGSYSCAAAIAPDQLLPAEVRVFRSNIAILPLTATPYQWRLDIVDNIAFNSENYTLTLSSGKRGLVIGKLAKKTEEFREKLQQQFDALRERSASVMHQTFPFLDPDQLERLLATLPEGRSVPFAKLAKVHPKLLDAILSRTVGEHLRPYFDALRVKSMVDSIMVGCKFIRDDEAEDSDQPESETEPGDEVAQDTPLFFRFFFPLLGPNGRHSGLAAWEAGTGSGRATYFFHTGQSGESAEHVEAAMERLTEGLALVNFRREPIYLSDDSLARTPKFHRYSIGCRKLPELRGLRNAFSGRAIHSSFETWAAAVERILSGES